MPLPQQVINQLSQDKPATPGWSAGVIFFSTAIFAIVVGIYFVLLLIYGPYLSSQLSSAQSKAATLDQSIASGDQAQLVSFYSEVTNLQSLLRNHVILSQFLTWLEQNTETNVYYSELTFTAGGQVTLIGDAKAESDVNEQIAVFESSPQIEKVAVSNVGTGGANGGWTFTVTLVVSPTLFTAANTSMTTSTIPMSASTTTP